MSRVKIISCVTSDLITDQRVHRVCTTLTDMGFDVLSVGREKEYSPPIIHQDYATKRLKTRREKGPRFYAQFNWKLFHFLFWSKVDVILANDLDTLPACAMASLLRRKPLVYDSHEYFTEVPELIHRPNKRLVWAILEWIFIRRVRKAYTVSDGIARELFDRYGKHFDVVRNLPNRVNLIQVKREPHRRIKSDIGEKILLYQGSVNMGRGLEEMLEAMTSLEGYILYIIGDGDILEDLKMKREELGLEEKVIFTGRLRPEEMVYYTVQAHLGLSIEKKMGKSYYYALPNKVFDYIQAGIPCMISDLPELNKLNLEHNFGAFCSSTDPKFMVRRLERIFGTKGYLQELRTNARKAAKVLNWENESEKIRSIYADFLDPKR